MAEVKVELSAEEWGQVMLILQSGVYRVVAPLLQKISMQVQAQMIPKEVPNEAANIEAQQKIR